MGVRAFLTPENDPEGSVDITLTIPSGIEWEAAVRGCLLLLLDVYNWEESGSWTAADTTAEFAPGIYDLFENWPSP